MKTSFLGRWCDKNLAFLFLLSVLGSCEKEEVILPGNATIISFSTNEQTLLSTSINPDNKKVRLEVAHQADIMRLTPVFELEAGESAYVNGVKQVSGSSEVDFSSAVTYEIKDEANHSTSWEVAIEPLRCKILIDASHDGGVWWFPQFDGTGYDPNQPHQGQAMANLLRDKGFEVTELGRDKELTEEMFFGYYIVIRANGFNAYTPMEVQVYSKLLERGMNLVFFTDHKKNDPVDEIGDLLGLDFKGAAMGTVKKFAPHAITKDMTSISYIAGSYPLHTDQNPDIQILGWLGEDDYVDLNFNEIRDSNEPSGVPVMGVLNYPHSRIFFMGDMNGLEIHQQPFINNLIKWMGDCPFQ